MRRTRLTMCDRVTLVLGRAVPLFTTWPAGCIPATSSDPQRRARLRRGIAMVTIGTMIKCLHCDGQSQRRVYHRLVYFFAVPSEAA